MHVLAKPIIVAFYTLYPDARTSLLGWFAEAEHQRWRTFAEVRESFGNADRVGKFTVFNIAGGKYRLIAHIHHNRNKLFIDQILTHEDYIKGDWKRD